MNRCSFHQTPDESCAICMRTEPVPAFNAPGRGVKHDQGKPQWHLLPLAQLEGAVRVLEFGAAKYDRHQWRNGFPHTQPFAAVLRHLIAWESCQDLDPESGLPHLDHALCSLLFLITSVREHPELDDRYRRPE